MGNKNTEAVRKSREKHHIVEIRINIPEDEKNKIIEHAGKKGMRLATYIKDLIRKDMEGNI